MYCICVYGSDGKESACNVRDTGSIPGSGRSPGKGTGYPLSILDWRIPWTKKTGSLQSMKSQNVRHDWETNTFTVHLHSKRSSRDAIKAPSIQRELTRYSYTRLQQCQKKKGKWLSKTRVTKSRENILSLTQGASCIINKIRDHFISLCF